MSHAKHAWNELYRLRLDPASWTKKTLRAASYFSHIMKTDFPEFGYCEGDWKVERFAIIKYPDWCRDARETGQLTRARPSKHKSGDGENLKDSHKRKRAKIKTMLPVPRDAQVIDLANDIQAGSSSSVTMTTPANPPECASESTGLPLSGARSPPPPPPSSPAIIPRNSDTAPHPPLPMMNSGNSDTPLPTSATTGQGMDAATLGPAAGGQDLRPRHVSKPLAGITIRKPSFEVPVDEPSATSSGGPTSVARSAKAGKLMVASLTVLSARNLFALEYLKDHAPTISEFKIIWDNVSSDTKKKYEALSKEKKAAARVTATTST
ncbi:hypothetical protein BJV77DRAFT_1069130 [Russula vinacea]|nr:hypothetical protein BJV77DRAFT_1069130 [Russula vinacea]